MIETHFPGKLFISNLYKKFSKERFDCFRSPHKDYQLQFTFLEVNDFMANICIR